MTMISHYPELARAHVAPRKTRPLIVSVTSGKGGVGKSLTSVNLAIAARKMGKSVLILDGDLGLANIDVLLGLTAKHNISDVLDGNIPLKDIVLEGPLGIQVIPSGSGITKLCSLSHSQRIILKDKLDALDIQPEILIVDTGAGISDNVLHFNNAADKVVVVTTPEPHAMTDAYALIKVMAEEHGKKRFNLLVNQVRSEEEGIKVYGRIADVAKRFLDAIIDYAGHVPMDQQVQRNVMLRRAASESASMTVAGQAWNAIALKAFSEWCNHSPNRGGKGAWQHIMIPTLNTSISSVQTRV